MLFWNRPLLTIEVRFMVLGKQWLEKLQFAEEGQFVYTIAEYLLAVGVGNRLQA